jgi:vacuolar-type H+-ATPase subunit H
MKTATVKESGTPAPRKRAKSDREKELCGHKFKVVGKGLDQAKITSFLGNLIEENNTLLKKLQHMDSLMELAESAVAGARKQAERITLEAEEEASNRASAIIADAEQRARAESDRITSEARQEAERSAQEKLEEAARKAEEIEAQAEEQASTLLVAANQKANELVNQRMASAEQEAQEIVRQKKEQFKKIYQKLLASLDSIDISDMSDISAKLSMDDILSGSEETEATEAPQKIKTLSLHIPLPGFLRQRVNKS